MTDENKKVDPNTTEKTVSETDDFDNLVTDLKDKTPQKNQNDNQPIKTAEQYPIGHGFVMSDPEEEPPAKPNSTTGSVQQVPIDQIAANPYQPRKTFDPVRLAELAESIKFQGIIQPIVLVKTSDGYEILVGERRFRAALMAGLSEVPAIIRGEMSDRVKLELALIENVQREDLNPIEEARAYARLAEEFSLKQEQIAKKVGKSRPAIANVMRLLNLPAQIQRAVIENKLAEGHARALLPLDKSPEQQMEVFNWTLSEGVTVREVENKVREIKKLPLKPYIRGAKGLPTDPGVKQMEDSLREKLGTKVRLQKTGDSGKIMIEFYSKEELEKIVKRLSAEFNGGEGKTFVV